MNDEPRLKTNRYALKALKDRRAEIAAEIHGLKKRVQDRHRQLAHIDASILLLDPSTDLRSLRRKRIVKNVQLFRQGELGRMILGVLREANGSPVPMADIVAVVMRQSGFEPGVRRTIAERVRTNCGSLARCGKITRVGKGREARWCLA